MRCTTDDGVDIAYDRAGAGPAIVFVHGLTDSRADWRPVVERLAADFTCVTLDLRAHGESGDAPDYSALAMTADVAAVVQAEDLSEPAVIGHSLGGAVVTAYASEAPVAAVINVDQSMRFSDLAAQVRSLEPALRGDSFGETIGMILESMVGPMADPDLRAELAAHRARARQDIVLGVWGLLFSAPDEVLDGLADTFGATISAPYLALHGLDPGPRYVEWLQARIPQAVVEVWPEHGHWVHLVAPDRFCARVRELVGP
ncbi:MAG: alpha/beta fold hydrolase [Actinobacteria bacterium]|nr:MAG: alpha/beta fold hydrolase [Actinomycetota bacterium]